LLDDGVHTACQLCSSFRAPLSHAAFNRPSLARAFFFAASFFATFRRAVDRVAFFFIAALSAARFSAQRFLVASEMALCPAALIRRLFYGGGAAVVFVAGFWRLLLAPVISRNAEIARSIAARCCSKSAMMRSTSVNDSPPVNYGITSSTLEAASASLDLLTQKRVEMPISRSWIRLWTRE
jgi:hypothetical protein